MMIELHDVTIGQLIKGLSATVDDGQTVCFSGAQGAGKTTLLRALLGFIPIDGGHISIDGELLTPQSAPYFRRFMAYVPQHLSVPDGYDKVPTDYVLLGLMSHHIPLTTMPTRLSSVCWRRHPSVALPLWQQVP